MFPPQPIASNNNFGFSQFQLSPCMQSNQSPILYHFPEQKQTMSTMSVFTFSKQNDSQAQALKTVRKKRNSKVKKANKRDLQCRQCGTKETPEWRSGPDGEVSLCNACGLNYRKKKKKEDSDMENVYKKMAIANLLNH